jgi:hypothetical protein
LPFIRRISREHLEDSDQDFSIDQHHILLKETPMNTLTTKLTAFAAALAMNGLVMGALGYLFALQSHPNLSGIAFTKAVVAHQWLFFV